MLNLEALAQNGWADILAPLLTSYVAFIKLFNFCFLFCQIKVVRIRSQVTHEVLTTPPNKQVYINLSCCSYNPYFCNNYMMLYPKKERL